MGSNLNLREVNFRSPAVLTAIGRELPEHVDGYCRVAPFAGAFATRPGARRHAPPVKTVQPGASKLVGDIREVFERIPIRDGMTLSFHHHLRDGDGVVNAVLDTAAELGVKGLKVASSSVFPVHALMVEHFESGVVAALDTDYLSGPVAEACCRPSGRWRACSTPSST
jgi:citrate lyase subunit alpha / citrate CoA-transferase